MFSLAWAAEELRDIKPPLYFPRDSLLALVLGIVCVLAAGYFLGRFLIKKFKAKKEALPPPKPAYQIAYEALRELKSQDLPAKGRLKEYYFQLSIIARHYIEGRFNIRAPEMTTEEFLFSLRDSDILSGTHKNLLKEFLGLCDIVKFAKYGPTSEEIENSFQAALRLVDETKVLMSKCPKNSVIG